MDDENTQQNVDLAEENKQTGEPNASPDSDGGAKPQEGDGANAVKEDGKEPKTFTQDEVNELVKRRIERERKSIYSKYGFESSEELEQFLGKGQAYDSLKEKCDAAESENQSLKKSLAFMRNDINPSRESDIDAYYKGTGKEFSEDSLKEEIKTHPEWLNPKKADDKPKTTFEKISPERGEDTQMDENDERELVAKLTGLNRII